MPRRDWTTRYHKDTNIGTVVAVGNGTFDFLVDGSPEPYGGIPAAPSQSFVGYRCPIGFDRRNRQMPFLMGSGRRRKIPGSDVVTEVILWNQFHGIWSCARLVTHKITGDTMASLAQEWTLEVTN